MSGNTITIAVLAALTMALGCEEKQAPAPKPAAPTKQPAVQSTPAVTKPPAPQPAPTPSSPAPTPAAAAGATISVMGLSFTLPVGWKQLPVSSPMRLAEAQVPDASGDAAKSCAIAFSTAGGEIQANIDRWAGQVVDASSAPSKPKITKRDIAGMPVTIADMTGAYAGMGDTTPHANWTLHAAIIESAGGLLFIKMVGPAEQMAAAAGPFDAMIDGLKKQ